MALDLRQRNVLLTGASRGIGTHIARALAARGANLWLTARDAAQLQDTARDCEAAGAAAGAKVEIVPADLCSASDRAGLVEAVGEIEILINNAGVEHAKAFLDQSDAEVAAQLELNLAVPIDLTRRLLPGMLARGAGAVVNVASMSGKGATPYNSVYAGTKYGLTGWSASLRIELLGTGVHVGVVCPGFVREGMWGRTGLRAPKIMGAVSPEAVVAGVLEVVHGAPEVLVTSGPVRPFLALCALFPWIEAPVMRRTGIVETLRRRAELGKGE